MCVCIYSCTYICIVTTPSSSKPQSGSRLLGFVKPGSPKHPAVLWPPPPVLQASSPEYPAVLWHQPPPPCIAGILFAAAIEGSRIIIVGTIVKAKVCSKALALIWYRAWTGYSSPARPLAAPDDPLLVTGQQGSPFPACRQLSRARNACAGSSSEESIKLKHGTKLGPTLC